MAVHRQRLPAQMGGSTRRLGLAAAFMMVHLSRIGSMIPVVPHFRLGQGNPLRLPTLRKLGFEAAGQSFRTRIVATTGVTHWVAALLVQAVKRTLHRKAKLRSCVSAPPQAGREKGAVTRADWTDSGGRVYPRPAPSLFRGTSVEEVSKGGLVGLDPLIFLSLVGEPPPPHVPAHSGSQ
jgi:hypothetical protein